MCCQPCWHSSCIPEQPQASGEGPGGTDSPWRRLWDGEGVEEGWELQTQSHHPTPGICLAPNPTAPPGVLKRASSDPDLSFLPAQVLRSYNNSSKPLYVSVGHRVSLDTAVRLVRGCCRFRIPEPIRQVRPLGGAGRLPACSRAVPELLGVFLRPWGVPNPRGVPSPRAVPRPLGVPQPPGVPEVFSILGVFPSHGVFPGPGVFPSPLGCSRAWCAPALLFTPSCWAVLFPQPLAVLTDPSRPILLTQRPAAFPAPA